MIHRRPPSVYPVSIALLVLALTAFGAESSRPGKLNVLLIVADDLRSSLGCYGAAEIKSPNIDRIAARGMRFDRAYCQYPVCNPSRSSFLTGLRPETIGILNNTVALRTKHPDAMTLPQLFREQGYFTASLGKIMHLGLDADGQPALFQDPKSWVENRNFEATKVGRNGEGRNLTGGKLRWCRWLAAEGTDEDQPDGQCAAAAVRLLEQHRDGPFFIGVGFHKPHDPFIAPKKYFDLYPLEHIPLARDPADRTPDLELALPNRTDFAAFTDQERREFKRAYQAGISFTDTQIGKLLDTLDRLKLWDNTVVVMMGDHGYHLGEHGWWNKVTLFELCARTPLIIWAPGMKGMGQSTRAITEFVDLFPTLADLCAVKPPTSLEGKSLRPVLNTPSLPGKQAAHTIVTRGARIGRSVRTDRWRYTEWEDGKAGIELYDHTNDHLEYHNLAARPDLAGVRAELKALLRVPGAGSHAK
jgi:iduronate 2-sulfatase